ncbi:DUF2783 domain-containing protein [Pararhizobium sp. IMCC21322]|uniref:DUF2783 domain-containing protein n=1 Tax=Pararhizobium sp. IMCC21322 TaxID=3067903 RepID=UPI002740DE2F|nr:DUF2783 domain-containing protein [Pararhizobium sp. IMCC21322]
MTGTPDNLSPNSDDFYAALMEAHEGLTFADSQALNARLVLLLANEIGDLKLLKQLLDTAKP